MSVTRLTGWRETVRRVLSLLWVGRLSWMRIALSVLYGATTYYLVQTWHVDVPDIESQGWLLAVVPPGLAETVMSRPNVVGAFVLLLIALCVVGLGTRPALLALVIIGLFARTLEVSQGVFDHESSLTTQVLFILVFAPGTNAVSLEHLIRWWWAGRKDFWSYLTRPFRQWGTYLILAVLAVTYTASGLAKLRFGGLGWLDGQTLGFYLRGLTAGDVVYNVGGGPSTWRDDFGLQMYTYGNYSYGRYGPAALAAVVDWMAHTPAIMSVLSIATVVLELAGLLLFVPRLRSVLLVGYIGMHTAIGILMGLPFIPYQIVCFLLIEWERVIPFVLSWFEPKKPPAPNEQVASGSVGSEAPGRQQGAGAPHG